MSKVSLNRSSYANIPIELIVSLPDLSLLISIIIGYLDRFLHHLV